MNKNKLSFVIPCYGSEKTIKNVIFDIITTTENKNPYEIICVNDCSPDNVYEVLENLSNTYKNLKVINLAKNFGQHSALMAGFRYVSGDIIICLDDDGQTDPKECYSLINALSDKNDIVIAKYPKKEESLFRLFGSWTAKKMGQWLCSIPKNIDLNSYFVCKRFVINEVIKYENAYPYLEGLLFRVTKKAININIPHYKRASGHSGYSFKKLISLWLNGFTAFSVKPLRVATFLGLITSFLGFAYAIYTFINRLLNPNLPMGYSSIMCILLFIGGMLMVILGLIGEYIGRIYICMNKAPQYVIKNTINIEN